MFWPNQEVQQAQEGISALDGTPALVGEPNYQSLRSLTDYQLLRNFAISRSISRKFRISDMRNLAMSAKDPLTTKHKSNHVLSGSNNFRLAIGYRILMFFTLSHKVE